MRQLKGKKKDKFASLKPLQTWNFLPPCAGHGHGLSSLPAAAVWQLSQQYQPLDYGRNQLYSSRSPVCLLCSQERGAASAFAQRCLQLLHSLAPGTSNADPWPEAALAGPHHHHPAPGQRTSRTLSTGAPCSVFVTCSVPSAVPGKARLLMEKHDPECSPTPSHAVEIKQCLKSSGFTSLFLRPAEGVDSPQSFPCGRHSPWSSSHVTV